MHFEFMDIFFLILVLFFAVTACSKGFLKELFGKIAVVAGVVVAVVFSSSLSPYLEKFIKVKTLSVVIAFILLFIATFLLVKIIQTLISSIFSGDILKSLDKILGFALGAVEGIGIVCALLILIKAQPWFSPAFIDRTFFWSCFGSLLQKPVEALGTVFA